MEGFLCIRVWDRLPRLGIGEGGELGELLAAAFAHRIGEVVVEIGEEQERALATVFVTHEQQRDLRAEQEQRGGRAQFLRVGEQRQAFAHRAVADLVVVLEERDERGRRQVCAGFAARLAVVVGRALPLVDEAFAEAACEAFGRTV